jgi:hypothetical protein
MSAPTQTVQPPSGVTPQQLNLGAVTYYPSTDGLYTFTIPSQYIGALLAAGWSLYSATSFSTNVP